jgi:CHASE3 domain sensor protein
MPQHKSDHDTLTGFVSSFNEWKSIVNDKFTEVRNDIKEIRDGAVTRIENLEKSKADRVEVDKLQVALNLFQKHVNENVEERVNSLEDSKKWIWVIVAGYILIASCVIGYCVLRIDANFTLITNYMEQTK